MAEQSWSTGSPRSALWLIAGLTLLTWPLGLGWVVVTEQQDAALTTPAHQLQTEAARIGQSGLRLARGETAALAALAREQRAFSEALRRLRHRLAQNGPLPRSTGLEMAAREVAAHWRRAGRPAAEFDADGMTRAAGAITEMMTAATELAAVGEELTPLRVEQGARPSQVYIAAREQGRALMLRLQLRELVAGDGRAEVMALRLRQDAETLSRGIAGLRQGDPQRGIQRVGSSEGRALLKAMAGEAERLVTAARRLEAESKALEALHRWLAAEWWKDRGVRGALTRLEELLAERRSRREWIARSTLAVGAVGLLLLGGLILVPRRRVPPASSVRIERVGPQVAPPPRPPRLAHSPLGRQKAATAFWPAAPYRGGDWLDALKALQPGLQLALLEWYRARDETSVRMALFRLAEVLARMEAAVRAAVAGEAPVPTSPPPAAADLLEVLGQARVVARLLAHQGEQAGWSAERRFDVPRLLGQVERAIGTLAEAGPQAGFQLEATAREALAELARSRRIR